MPIPVALFTYNRPKHTKATLDALARNSLASRTELFVFSDGPKGEAAGPAVAAVRELIRSASGFASVSLIERDRNLGVANSIITGVTEMLDVQQNIIVLEDDLITSQHFLAYMNEALVHYRADPFAFSVTGHTFPPTFLQIPDDYPFDTYAGYRCSSWSWGTWPDRWRRVDWGMNYFAAFCDDARAQEAFNCGGQDMTTLLTMQRKGTIDSWAIRFCFAHYANNMRCIYPTKTLVRNIGLDSSGRHSAPEPRYFHPSLDEDWMPKRFCPAEGIDTRIAKNFRSIFDPSPAPGNENARKRSDLGRLVRQLSRGLVERVKRLSPGHSSRRQVDILVVNTMQKDGGAARAVYRSFLGIKRLYPEAHYLTLIKEDDRDDISGLPTESTEALKARNFMSVDQKLLKQYPNRRNLTLFTPGIAANPLRIPLSRFSPRLVHLNWVAASMLRIEDLSDLKVPIVWTLHDTWAFTGGCHYTANCQRFVKCCGTCPQLGSTMEHDLSRSLWQRKQDVYSTLDLTIIAPSRWMATLVRQSSLLGRRRVEVIPNGLDTEVFKPFDKKAAKAYFDIDPAHPVLLFGAQWLLDHRKGGDLLREAVARLDFPCTLFMFGAGSAHMPTSEFVTARAFGSLKDDIALALLYSAADVFVCPSREDNLPNTVAEALACGTPCAAFDINGLPDMIEHQKTGWLAKAFDAADLAVGIKWLATNSNPEPLRARARDKALAEYSLRRVTEKYADLYAELLGL